MKINVLIRTSYRPHGFARAIKSVLDQTYKNIRIIVSYDNHNALKYIPDGIEKIKVSPGSGKYFYDDYCNILKSMVNEGYFFFLDDDDMLSSPDVIEKLVPLLPETGLIVQLKRGNLIVPQGLDFKSGKIGMPCLILNHKYKDIADITVNGAGDSVWIMSVINQIELKFEPMILVHSFMRGGGKQEKPIR